MKKVISIVEDEKDLNELVKQYLQKEGYEVRSYLTFDEAQLHTGDDDVHLWILDIMLGDKSGFDLIEEIRRVNPEVPVIFMSAAAISCILRKTAGRRFSISTDTKISGRA